MTKCPKKPQEKCDYSKTVIYKIECKDPNITKTYGGHTTNLIKRRALHKSDCNNPNGKSYNTYVYTFIRKNGGWSNWQVVWQYDYPCENVEQAKLEETKFIKEQKCELNSVMPYVSVEEKKEKKQNMNIERLANETEEEKKERKQKNNQASKKSHQKKIANETPEEKKARLKKKNESQKEKRENETEEEKAEK